MHLTHTGCRGGIGDVQEATIKRMTCCAHPISPKLVFQPTPYLTLPSFSSPAAKQRGADVAEAILVHHREVNAGEDMAGGGRSGKTVVIITNFYHFPLLLTHISLLYHSSITLELLQVPTRRPLPSTCGASTPSRQRGRVLASSCTLWGPGRSAGGWPESGGWP